MTQTCDWIPFNSKIRCATKVLRRGSFNYGRFVVVQGWQTFLIRAREYFMELYINILGWGGGLCCNPSALQLQCKSHYAQYGKRLYTLCSNKTLAMGTDICIWLFCHEMFFFFRFVSTIWNWKIKILNLQKQRALGPQLITPWSRWVSATSATSSGKRSKFILQVEEPQDRGESRAAGGQRWSPRLSA